MGVQTNTSYYFVTNNTSFALPQARGFRSKLLEAASSFLGLSKQEIRSSLSSGKSLANITQSEGKSIEDLKNALTDAVSNKGNQETLSQRLDQLIQTHSQDTESLSSTSSSIPQSAQTSPQVSASNSEYQLFQTISLYA